MKFDLDFCRAFGEPCPSANFREQFSDFKVDEILGFRLSGEGEHLCLHIKKRGENTQYVAGQIARFFGVKKMDVGFCGLKDRYAETTQWFSIYLPGSSEPFSKEDIASGLELDIDILELTRHRAKLRRGQHSANHFSITLRDLSLENQFTEVHKAQLNEKLEKIRCVGVPNYFGEQRFGREMQNLVLADEWFSKGVKVRDKAKRGFVMSAARSYLFNQVLSCRVSQGNWRKCLPGEVPREDSSPPTGPLWGRGTPLVTNETLDLEVAALGDYGVWREQLEHCGLKQERRPLLMNVDNLSWEFFEQNMQLDFTLAAGQFATSFLRELVVLKSLAGNESVCVRKIAD